MPCALNTFVSQVPSSLNSRTDTLPSLEAQAKIAPSSWGAQAMLLMEDVCNVCSKSLDQLEICGELDESRQMMTLASYDAEARIVPNLGWAQATCHTGPS